MKNHVDCIAKQLKWMIARNAMNMIGAISLSMAWR